MPTFAVNNENKENIDAPLQKRKSTLTLNLRRVSASSFMSNRSLTPTSPNTPNRLQHQRSSSRLASRTMSRLRDSFLRPRESVSDLISLPVPMEDSKEKFTSKLRAQASVLSLRANQDAYANQQQQLLQQLLSLCTEKEVLKVSPEIPQDTKGSTPRLVHFGPGGVDLSQVVRELSTYKLAPPGFVQTIAAYVVGDQELCLHHQLANCGTPLDNFALASWAEAYEVFWQVAGHLSSAERRFQLEHRDLLPQHIFIERNPFTSRLTVTIGGLEHARLRLPTGEVVYSRLDHHYFFNADERRRAVYRSMQQMLIETSNDRSDPEWDQFQPRTNVLWLHVLAEYLLGQVGGPEHSLRKRLAQIEAVLNPWKRRLLRVGFKDLESAGDVVAWGDRSLR